MSASNKSLETEVTPVESDSPNGGFRLILSCDDEDRDGDSLWADQWGSLPPKITMDTDHAWAKGQSIPFTAGSGVPHIDKDGNLVVEGTFAGTDHGQLTRKLINEGHIWQASVSYLEHETPDGSIERELLKGTFTGDPANPKAIVLESKSLEDKESDMVAEAVSKKSGGTTEGQYAPDEGPFADPKNRKWPLNTRKHILNAWARIHQDDATKNYNESEIATMTGRIRSAARREGITLGDDNSKALVELGSKMLSALAHNGKLKLEDIPGLKDMTQTTPGHTVAENMGAVSVYDQDDDDSDDDGDEDEDGGGEDDNSLAQSLHDAACALGFCCEDSIAQTGAPMEKSISVPLSIVTAGPPEQRMYSVFADGKPVAHGAVKDLFSSTPVHLANISNKAENKDLPSQVQEAIDGIVSALGSGGTALASALQNIPARSIVGLTGAEAPEVDNETDDNSSEQETASPGEEVTAAASKDAAAVTVSPADVAARHKARLRAFEFRTKASKHASITEKENNDG